MHSQLMMDPSLHAVYNHNIVYEAPHVAARAVDHDIYVSLRGALRGVIAACPLQFRRLCQAALSSTCLLRAVYVS